MNKPYKIAIAILALGIISAANSRAQQTPPASTQTPPAATSQSSPAAKTQKPAAAKTTQPAAKPAPLVLTTDKDKLSYALGMNFGKMMHGQAVKPDEVSFSIMTRGMQDEFAGGKTLLTDAEVRDLLNTYQAALKTRQQEAQKEAMETNKTAGEAFLAANKTKEGVVALPSGLQYKILTAGTGPKPTASDTVVCNYVGTLIDGKEFDSSVKRGKPATFPVGGVIKGWTEALQLMPVGSKWELFIPPNLAYGERGPSADIGPNSTLIFQVELLSIQAKAAAAPAAAPAPTTQPKPQQ
jgi:FKBP-type peptidyl-prolyl cis-trans isomerase FklB